MREVKSDGKDCLILKKKECVDTILSRGMIRLTDCSIQTDPDRMDDQLK